MKVLVFPEQLADIQAHLDKGRRIQAIGYVRAKMRSCGIVIGLVEAKKLVYAIDNGDYKPIRHLNILSAQQEL